MTLITRHWVMPAQWTFSMKPVVSLLHKYRVNGGWVDPFAGITSPAELRNDIEPHDGLTHQMDALCFLQSLPSDTFEGVLFDPPYSVEQCLRCYTPKQGGTAGRMEYWTRCKDEIMRILLTSGTVISFGWDSSGIGKRRGFQLVELMLLCHGACHHDTIVTVETKQQAIAHYQTELYGNVPAVV